MKCDNSCDLSVCITTVYKRQMHVRFYQICYVAFYLRTVLMDTSFGMKLSDS